MKLGEYIKNMISRADSLSQSPQAVRKRHMKSRAFNKRAALICCIAAGVLLAGVYIALVLPPSDAGQSGTVPEASQTSLEQDYAAALSASADKSVSANVLIAFCAEDSSTLSLLCLAGIDSEQGRLNFEYIPTSTEQTVNRLPGTMRFHFKNGGITELMWAVGEYTGSVIERYVLIDADGLSALSLAAKSVELDIPYRIEHSYLGLNFIIEAGRQTLTSDTLLKYAAYLCSTLSENEQLMNELMLSLARRFVCGENGESLAQQSFESVVNLVSTNISAMDVSAHANALAELIYSAHESIR